MKKAKSVKKAKPKKKAAPKRKAAAKPKVVKKKVAAKKKVTAKKKTTAKIRKPAVKKVKKAGIPTTVKTAAKKPVSTTPMTDLIIERMRTIDGRNK